MNSGTESLQKVRSEAQLLHERIQKEMAADDAARRVQLEEDAKTAQQLEAALKSLTFGQNDQTQQHLSEAAARLHDVAAEAKKAVNASADKVKEANSAMRERAEAAISHLNMAAASGPGPTSKT
jgi:predicted nucleotide-binding protein (sugar kinase/HSP70/actin superfamily)